MSVDEKTQGGFSEAEREAMRARAEELRNEGRGGKKKADEAQKCLDAIAAMDDADRVLAERVHAIVAEVAPQLDAKTWYGMPAYARDGKVVVFFQGAAKFGARYATLGFNDTAALDDGTMWPTAFALRDITDDDAARITELVRRAVG
ncbi:iron chaperone [Nocardioides sp. CPCC 205120]|uniref:iron chaperone n=1 Tax=Nocardioides sp. CPCC 205120 TaxID=3406462 RepID=UPI003B510842